VSELRTLALQALEVADPRMRCASVRAISGSAPIDPQRTLVPSRPVPGRPERPRLVAPGRLPRRSARSTVGHAALLHSVAHIEFNAIGLALDAIWRFPGMPDSFYRDWLRVAREETEHFSMLADCLAALGYAYGDFDAHDGLWEMAAQTRDDVLARMALVPRRLEARGLDASPPVRAKLLAAGDVTAAAVLDVILRDEIGHVAIGNRWFHWLCGQRRLDPATTDREIAARHRISESRGPLNLAARRAAGFSEEELLALQRAERGGRIPTPD
jgi:uncharacterized ferritin-like protein (DUF455 family)